MSGVSYKTDTFLAVLTGLFLTSNREAFSLYHCIIVKWG